MQPPASFKPTKVIGRNKTAVSKTALGTEPARGLDVAIQNSSKEKQSSLKMAKELDADFTEKEKQLIKISVET